MVIRYDLSYSVSMMQMKKVNAKNKPKQKQFLYLKWVGSFDFIQIWTISKLTGMHLQQDAALAPGNTSCSQKNQENN